MKTQTAPDEGSPGTLCYVENLDATVTLSYGPYREPDREWAVWAKIGATSLGHVFRDDRYDDGLLWVFVGDGYEPARFESSDAAVSAMLEAVGLQCPVGFFDRAEKVKNGGSSRNVLVDKVDEEVI